MVHLTCDSRAPGDRIGKDSQAIREWIAKVVLIRAVLSVPEMVVASRLQFLTGQLHVVKTADHRGCSERQRSSNRPNKCRNLFPAIQLRHATVFWHAIRYLSQLRGNSLQSWLAAEPACVEPGGLFSACFL
jgi:hypothetical protein